MSNGVTLLLRYVIEKKEKLGTRWLKCCKTPDKQTQFKVTDVDEGSEVQFQVRAENEAGVGDPSEPTEILTIEDASSKKPYNIYSRHINIQCRSADLFFQHSQKHFRCKLRRPPLFPGAPSPPLEVAIPDASREHINVTWKPPAKDGGNPITGYHVEVAEARPELKWLRVNNRPIKELNFRIDDGIKPEKKYVIRVRAINSIGVSDPSEVSDKVFTKDPDCKNPKNFIFKN